MSDDQPAAPIPADSFSHLENITANLQLVADLGYGDAALAWLEDDGTLTVLADARPPRTPQAPRGAAPRA
jgi:hypothetical protein